MSCHIWHIGGTLVQAKTLQLLGVKLYPKLALAYYQLHCREQPLVKFEYEYVQVHERKGI